MIYFNICNNYSYLLSAKHAETLVSEGFPVTFIRYKSQRNFQVNENELWKTIWLEGFPYINLRRPISSFYKNITNLKQLENISFCKNDIFFVAHEYELNVPLLAKKAKRSGAMVVLSDEAVGTYLSFVLEQLYPENIWNSRIQKFLYPLIYKDIYLLDGPFRMDDKWYDYFLLTYKINIKRNIKTIYIKHPLLDLDKSYELLPSRAMLLTSVPDEREQELIYWNVLEDLLPKLKSKFEKVYLKLHPGEYSDSRRDKREKSFALANKYGLEITENVIAESIISEYKTKYIISFYSSTLFNSIAFGCQPIFLCQFLEENKIVKFYNSILKGLNYNFIKSLDDINTNYNSGIRKEDLFEFNYSIADFVRDHLCKR